MPTSPLHRVLLILAGCLAAAVRLQAADGVPVYRWTTLAGRAPTGSEDGPRLDARFYQPRGLAADSAGNLYVADSLNHTIRRISVLGEVTTLAGSPGLPGSADGRGATARFNTPSGIAVDAAGNVYVADTENHTIRRIAADGTVTTLAGKAGESGTVNGPADVARFDRPWGLSVDPGGTVYVGQRKIAGGVVSALAVPSETVDPEGQPITVKVSGTPACDAAGNLYFWAYQPGSYYGGARIVKLNPAGQLSVVLKAYRDFGADSGGIFNNVAGGIFVTFNYLDRAAGQTSFIGNRLLPDGTLTGGPMFLSPWGWATTPEGLAVDAAGNWFYTRQQDSAIMTGSDKLHAGVAVVPEGIDGRGTAARFASIADLTVTPDGRVWVLEENYHYYRWASSGSDGYSPSLRTITTEGVVATILPPNLQAYHQNYAVAATADAAGNVYYSSGRDYFPGVGVMQVPVTGPSLSLGSVPPSSYTLTTDPTGNLWIYSGADRKVYRRAAGGAWLAVAGSGAYGPLDGSGEQAAFATLNSLCADASGACYGIDVLHDNGNQPRTAVIRRITADGKVTTIGPNLIRPAGAEPTAQANVPGDLALDSAGNFLFVRQNQVVRLDAQGRETPLGGVAGNSASQDGIGEKARFNAPYALKVDRQDNLYLADSGVVRRGEFLGYTPGLTGQPQSQTVNAGGSASFSVTASGTPAPTYQWYFNGNPFSGATSSTLAFSNARSTDAGDYTVVVTNALGSVTSGKATLTITAAPVQTPPVSGGGGNNAGAGGGGAPSGWFLGALLAFAMVRMSRALR